MDQATQIKPPRIGHSPGQSRAASTPTDTRSAGTSVELPRIGELVRGEGGHLCAIMRGHLVGGARDREGNARLAALARPDVLVRVPMPKPAPAEMPRRPGCKKLSGCVCERENLGEQCIWRL